MHILIDTAASSIIGFANSADFAVGPGQILAPEPSGFDRAEADAWSWVDGALIFDPAAALSRAKTVRIARIKSEAAGLIAATDWNLDRARERESAGWATLAAVDAVLAKREAIRRSSDAAEASVLALADVAAVQAFAWKVDVAVASPARVTHATFLDALRALGEEVIPNILAAKDSSPALLQWWTYFDKAEVIAATDDRLLVGLQGLEIGGLIPEGGAGSVIAALTPAAI